MTTPAPAQLPGEPFSEALSEAAQAAGMSVRLILTIADAVRRASQKHHHGEEQELTEDIGQVAESWWSADELGKHLPASLLTHLTGSPDWPVMARQLMSLSRAGVDLTTFLPNLGTMASGVEHAVAKNIARIQAEGTDRWADLLRTTIPEGLVRDAILASPAWPDIAAHMGRLHDQGVDVARILNHAHAAGLGVDQAIAAAIAPTPATTPAPAPAAPAPGTAPTSPASAPAAAPAPAPGPAAPVTTTPQPTAPAPATAPVGTPAPAPAPSPAVAPPAPDTAQKPDPWAAPAVSTDAKNVWGPLTEGLNIPRDLDLGDRARALHQLDVTPGAHRTLMSRVNETLPKRDATLLMSSRQWPVLAHRMHRMAQEGVPFAAHLARIAPDTAAWRTGPPSTIAARLLLAAHHALTTPLDQALPTGPRVSTTPPAPAPPPPPRTRPRPSSPLPPNPPYRHIVSRPPRTPPGTRTITAGPAAAPAPAVVASRPRSGRRCRCDQPGYLLTSGSRARPSCHPARRRGSALGRTGTRRPGHHRTRRPPRSRRHQRPRPARRPRAHHEGSPGRCRRGPAGSRPTRRTAPRRHVVAPATRHRPGTHSPPTAHRPRTTTGTQAVDPPRGPRTRHGTARRTTGVTPTRTGR
ncbi:hypothetical protein ACH4MT_36700 [Streptomyces anulatus]